MTLVVILRYFIPEYHDLWNLMSFTINGFRKGTSTVDQISSLKSIVETRKLKKLSTFIVFIFL